MPSLWNSTKQFRLSLRHSGRSHLGQAQLVLLMALVFLLGVFFPCSGTARPSPSRWTGLCTQLQPQPRGNSVSSPAFDRAVSVLVDRAGCGVTTGPVPIVCITLQAKFLLCHGLGGLQVVEIGTRNQGVKCPKHRPPSARGSE